MKKTIILLLLAAFHFGASYALSPLQVFDDFGIESGERYNKVTYLINAEAGDNLTMDYFFTMNRYYSDDYLLIKIGDETILDHRPKQYEKITGSINYTFKNSGTYNLNISAYRTIANNSNCSVSTIRLNGLIEKNGFVFLLNLNNEAALKSVDSKSKDITIPESVTYNNADYSVTEIQNSVFQSCGELDRVTISKNIKKIYSQAFSGCKVSEVVLLSGYLVENGLSHNKNESADDIFGENVKKYILGENVSVIGDNAFLDSKAEICFERPESITKIGENAFRGCSQPPIIKDCTNLTSICQYAYYGTNISSIDLPKYLTRIDSYAFPYEIKKIRTVPSSTLLTLWNSGYTGDNIYNLNTDELIKYPEYSFTDITQTTAKITIDNCINEFSYYLDPMMTSEVLVNIPWDSNDDKTVGLCADMYYYLTVTNGTVIHQFRNSLQTLPINLSINTKRTASSLEFYFSYSKGDIEIEKMEMVFSGETFETGKLKKTGLKPDNKYKIEGRIWDKNGYWYYTWNNNVSTLPLNFQNKTPKIISAGNVIISSNANIDDEEENVGFEWRRTDWTDDFSSNSAKGYVYEGSMEGYIHNLNTSSLWKYRPYYKANNGTVYYGDWTGIDPSNTSYFEPTIHTYEKYVLDGNSVTIKGLVLPGTDEIIEQGFEYWSKEANDSKSTYMNFNSTNGHDVSKVLCNGQVMEVTLVDLQPNSTYYYRSYAKTSSSTIYGEERSFVTGNGSTGIDNMEFGVSTSTITGYYDLGGRKFNNLQKGLNIIRYSDGSVRKVMLK